MTLTAWSSSTKSLASIDPSLGKSLQSPNQAVSFCFAIFVGRWSQDCFDKFLGRTPQKMFKHSQKNAIPAPGVLVPRLWRENLGTILVSWCIVYIHMLVTQCWNPTNAGMIDARQSSGSLGPADHHFQLRYSAFAGLLRNRHQQEMRQPGPGVKLVLNQSPKKHRSPALIQDQGVTC